MYREIIEAFMLDDNPHPTVSILAVLSGVYPELTKPHPKNGEEFAACMKLMEKSKECKNRFKEMSFVSEGWALLVDNLEELRALYKQESSANNKYSLVTARIKQLGCSE